ncbi:coniferyl aldehyde dehydrogenase [Marinobacter xestospongiae]|uniref:Aldehyde dehydrogenase n=1 Tax=Marinobacter xestospongiae TaxID=994319 RepID=A0ABU3VWE1_9GAMM|nr:coniferyl aldehyde dehydrogenase [Marinobacter xestospongiae]MCG8517590.1 coniferyl aldehyde dehydrogenase [Pseudomonadales bacterium]MCK7567313.1 coniferyl aldehyde dehydrogenase [Marinobacter xestospongiae]MDV2078597.1 coniferyl aldehyde dehydrogenase [Marinobacter xestospongiae]
MGATVIELTESKKQIQHIGQVFNAQRAAFRKNPMPSATERLENLKRLKRALLSNQERLLEAIDQDFSCRSRDETRIAEIMPSVQGINYAMKHLDGWMKPSKRHVSVLFQPASNQVFYQPKGVVGIIVPWNYPLFLAIGPLVAALAAGNRAMIKMSEFTPHTSALVHDILSATFPEDLVSVILGEADVAADFSGRAFDHLLFTGSTSVGRIVMRAAAENLTPVTLELGGKSPALVSADVPMADAAQRIAFGKAFNAGQTCVAPDYVLCPADRLQSFVDEFRSQFSTMYPSLRDNDDYTAIINERQYDRLRGYLDDARDKGAEIIEINPAGENLSDGTRKIPLTLVLNTTPDMKLMQDEIFGPILPVVSYDSLDDAIHYINERPRPLALYYFGYDKGLQQHVTESTHSGGMCINDALMHVAQDDLPFGGIGDSGMGHYHGKEGFLTFSHARSIFTKQRFNSGKYVYAPHGTAMHKLVYKLFIR